MTAAGILLAAGTSSRLGREKQMLSVRGRTFLRSIAEAMASVVTPLVVVLPEARRDFAAEVSGLDAEVETIFNPSLEKGLGLSVALAAQRLQARADAPKLVLLAVVDQPLASAELFGQLISAAVAGDGWAASDYGDGAWGVPAVLPGSELPALAALSGERGARPLLEARRAESGLALVAFPGGRFDIDTADDYERLLGSLGSPGSPES